jgi:predicted transposase/invertase (TIGR01784 family)
VPYRFQSVELKEKAQRSDAVLFPEHGAPPDAPVIVCEVQFREEKRIYTRLVSETALLALQLPPEQRFQMVLLLPDRQADTDAGVWKLLRDGGAIEVVYLDEALAHGRAEASFTPEEHLALLLMQFTVSPQNIERDMIIVPALASALKNVPDEAFRKLCRDLFVNLLVSKYRTLTKEELRAMIDTRDIFDDIGESRAVQQYAQQYAEEYAQERVAQAKVESKLESAIAMVRLGIPTEQVASVLHLPLEAIEHALRGS